MTLETLAVAVACFAAVGVLISIAIAWEARASAVDAHLSADEARTVAVNAVKTATGARHVAESRPVSSVASLEAVRPDRSWPLQPWDDVLTRSVPDGYLPKHERTTQLPKVVVHRTVATLADIGDSDWTGVHA